jgi:dolichol-phosphate mannosyltransferase
LTTDLQTELLLSSKAYKVPMMADLHLMERAGKLGLGTAYIAGFRWALATRLRLYF